MSRRHAARRRARGAELDYRAKVIRAQKRVSRMVIRFTVDMAHTKAVFSRATEAMEEFGRALAAHQEQRRRLWEEPR